MAAAVWGVMGGPRRGHPERGPRLRTARAMIPVLRAVAVARCPSGRAVRPVRPPGARSRSWPRPAWRIRVCRCGDRRRRDRRHGGSISRHGRRTERLWLPAGSKPVVAWARVTGMMSTRRSDDWADRGRLRPLDRARTARGACQDTPCRVPQDTRQGAPGNRGRPRRRLGRSPGSRPDPEGIRRRHADGYAIANTLPIQCPHRAQPGGIR